MEAQMIYRDGEEVEVGWFGVLLNRIQRFWAVCRQTDWKHYFKSNGPGEVTWEHFTGFRELQNSMDSCAQWCIQVKGGIRPECGNTYYVNITAYGMNPNEAAASKEIQTKVLQTRERIMLYADPDCSCRVGFHSRCRRHLTTQN